MKIRQEGSILEFTTNDVFCFYCFKNEKKASKFKELYEAIILNPKFKKSQIKIRTMTGDRKVDCYLIDNTNLAVHKESYGWTLDYIPTGEYIESGFKTRKMIIIGAVEMLAKAYDYGFNIFNE